MPLRFEKCAEGRFETATPRVDGVETPLRENRLSEWIFDYGPSHN
jgi:hypothetical protein